MCIIAVQYPGTSMSKESFDNCARTNRDGFGLMYVSRNKVRVYKSMKANDVWERYLRINSALGDKTPIVLHFRIGTAGRMDETNCHPFYVKDQKLAFVH